MDETAVTLKNVVLILLREISASNAIKGGTDMNMGVVGRRKRNGFIHLQTSIKEI